ncbi:MAG: hypothetical protein HC945_00925, partial [Nitrosarchaeum sp.]|nr:hypothetical protein [Nitrosarchaeum sp.]
HATLRARAQQDAAETDSPSPDISRHQNDHTARTPDAYLNQKRHPLHKDFPANRTPPTITYRTHPGRKGRVNAHYTLSEHSNTRRT